jgi:hypothetical protein
MPAPTVPAPLDGADFAGKSRSFTVLPGGKSWPTCNRCGSSLYGRRERVVERNINDTRTNVEVYRCRCRTGQEVRRPLGAAAA